MICYDPIALQFLVSAIVINLFTDQFFSGRLQRIVRRRLLYGFLRYLLRRLDL